MYSRYSKILDVITIIVVYKKKISFVIIVLKTIKPCLISIS